MWYCAVRTATMFLANALSRGSRSPLEILKIATNTGKNTSVEEYWLRTWRLRRILNRVPLENTKKASNVGRNTYVWGTGLQGRN